MGARDTRTGPLRREHAAHLRRSGPESVRDARSGGARLDPRRPTRTAHPDRAGSAAALIGFPAEGLAPLVQHAMGGPMPRLGKSDPLAAAYLAAVARTAEYVNALA